MKSNYIKCGEMFRTKRGTNCYLCTECGEEFENSQTIVNHMKIHYAVIPIDSIKVESESEDTKEAINIRPQQEELPKELNETDHSITVSHKTSIYFTCHICDKEFTIKYREKHLATHINLQQYKCQICYRGYNTSGALTRHSRIHADGFSLPTCDYCNRSFKNKYKLRQHMLKQHIDGYVIEIKYNCELCTRGFHSRSLYEAHMRRHRDEKPFQCAICGLAFVSVGCLNSHKRRHREKPHKCDLCSRAYFKPNQLNEHKKSHTGERAYNCPICGKPFGTRKVMGQHKRLHDAEKRYKCKFCKKTFAQSSGRRKHEKYKHRIKIEIPS